VTGRYLGFATLLGALATGCIGQPQHPAATQPATIVNLATTQPSYWMDQPPTATVDSQDFQKLWTSCEDVARDFLFRLDRQDYRSGILTTRPMVSGQWFEPWRRDNRRAYDVAESSIATIRRTITFEFTKEGDGWQVAPKVLVERQDISEKRITSVVRYRNVFAAPVGTRTRPYGTRESDLGFLLPERYWYPLRRDPEFERALARAVREKLNRS
jgi:hypothetical protein